MSIHKGDLVLNKKTKQLGVVIYKRLNTIKVNFEIIPFPKKWDEMTKRDIKEWEEENVNSSIDLLIDDIRLPYELKGELKCNK